MMMRVIAAALLLCSSLPSVSFADTIQYKTTAGSTSQTNLTSHGRTALGAGGTTGTGSLVYATSPTLTTPVMSSIINSGTLTLPTSTDTLVGRATTDTLTNKTLTAPVITGGTHTAITSLGIRSTGAAFDISLAATEVLTAGRSLTFTLGDANRSINLGGNITTAGAFTTAGANALTLTTTGVTGVTLPTTGTLSTLAGAETLTNKTLTSPTLTTPALGVATATSINKVAITAPATAATLTIPDGVTLTGPAASGTAMTLGNTETVTGVKTFGSAGAVGRLAIAGATSGATVLDASAVASGTLTLPAATDTLVGRATTDTLTNKTFDTAGAGNSFSINGVAASANTGTGAIARAAAPTFTTPSLTAPTITGGTHTAVTSLGIRSTGAAFDISLAATEVLTSGRTLTFTLNDVNRTVNLGGNITTAGAFTTAGANALTLTTTGATGVTLPTTGTLSTLAGTETLTNKTLTNPTLTTPALGVATATSINGLTVTTTSGVLTIPNGVTLTGPAASGTAMTLGNTETVMGVKTFGSAGAVGRLVIAGATSGATVLDASAIASGTLTLPAATDTLVGRATTDTLTNKTISGSSNTITNVPATALGVMTGDVGAGGAKGAVPAPGSGDSAALKFLKADGTWAVPAGGGGGSLSDTDRQNILLDRIYLAKVFGSYRRVLSAFADGYAHATSGINTGAASNYAVDTSGRRFYPTTSASMVGAGTGTVIGDMSGQGGNAAAFDGTTSAALAASARGAISTPHGHVGKDWGSGNSKTVVAYKVYAPNNTGYEAGSAAIRFTLKGSNSVPTAWDGTGYGGASLHTDDLAAGENVADNIQDYTSGIITTTAYRYHWVEVRALSGSNEVYLAEVQLYEPGAVNSMTVVTLSQTMDTSVSNARVLIEYELSDTPTLNTDLTAEVTCNGGSNWASATLSAMGTGQGGRLVAETADTACTSGTSFAARIKSANSKLFYVHGLSLTVH